VSGLTGSKSVPLVIGAVLLIAVLGGGWFLGVSPKREKAAQLATDLTSAEAELARKRAALAQPQVDVKIRLSDVYRLTKALPDSPQISGVLLDVARYAGRNELDLKSVTPAAPTAGQGYLTYPTAIVVQGRYASVASFLSEVSGLVTVRNKTLDARGRLYSISAVDLGQPGDELEFPIVRATVRLDAFTFVPTIPTTPNISAASNAPGGAVTAAGVTP
jgi:Tfp pilus assembly protein PilO